MQGILNEDTMYQIRTILFVFLSLLLLTACGDDKVTKDCVAAYNRATEKIMQAENSEQLLEISYALHLELFEAVVVVRLELGQARFVAWQIRAT